MGSIKLYLNQLKTLDIRKPSRNPNCSETKSMKSFYYLHFFLLVTLCFITVTMQKFVLDMNIKTYHIKICFSIYFQNDNFIKFTTKNYTNDKRSVTASVTLKKQERDYQSNGPSKTQLILTHNLHSINIVHNSIEYV